MEIWPLKWVEKTIGISDFFMENPSGWLENPSFLEALPPEIRGVLNYVYSVGRVDPAKDVFPHARSWMKGKLHSYMIEHRFECFQHIPDSSIGIIIPGRMFETTNQIMTHHKLQVLCDFSIANSEESAQAP